MVADCRSHCAIPRVARLRQGQMLTDQPLRIYVWIEEQLAARRPEGSLLSTLCKRMAACEACWQIVTG